MMSLLRADVPAFVPRSCHSSGSESQPQPLNNIAQYNSSYLGGSLPRCQNGNSYYYCQSPDVVGQPPPVYMMPNKNESGFGNIGTFSSEAKNDNFDFHGEKIGETVPEQNGNFLHVDQKSTNFSENINKSSHRMPRGNCNGNDLERTFINNNVSESVYSDGRGKSKDDKRKFNSALKDKQDPVKKERKRGRGGKNWNPSRVENVLTPRKGLQIMSKGTPTKEKGLCQIPEKVLIDDKDEFPELGTPFNAEKLVGFLPVPQLDTSRVGGIHIADVPKCDICTTDGCETRRHDVDGFCTGAADQSVPYAPPLPAAGIKVEDRSSGARPRERDTRVRSRFNSRTKKDLRSSSASHKKVRDKDYSDLNDSTSKNMSSDEKTCLTDKNKLNFYSNAEYKSVREKRMKEKERMKNRLSRTSNALKTPLNGPTGTVPRISQVLKSSSFDIEDSTSENVPLAEEQEDAKKPLTEAELEKKKKKTQLRKEKRKRERERKMMEKRMKDAGDTKIKVISQKPEAMSDRKTLGIVQNEEKFTVRFYEAEYPELGVSGVGKSLIAAAPAPAATKSYSTDSDWESVTEPESIETTSVNETDLMLTEEDEQSKKENLYSLVLQSAAPARVRGILKPVNSAPAPPPPVQKQKKEKKKTKKKKEDKKVKTRSNATITLADMIVMERPKVKRDKSERVRGSIVRRVREHGRYTGNVLDASAPSRRRKEREGGKKKKHSCLKKIILQERESRREQRLLLRGATMPDVKARIIQEDAEIFEKAEPSSCETASASTKQENRLIQKKEPGDENTARADNQKADSGLNDIITLALHDIKTNPKLWMHNRKFRDYCNHFLNAQLDAHVTHLMHDLVRFQDRLYHKDPIKARARKRIVIGLKEVNKNLKLNKLKCVIIAPDLEKVPTRGGLDEKIGEIVDLASSSHIPTVFALKKKGLGYLCKKKVPVSCIGILNYQGSEENFTKILEVLEELKSSYDRAYRSLADRLQGGRQKVNEVIPEEEASPEKEDNLTTQEKLHVKTEEEKSKEKTEGASARSGPSSSREINASFLDQLRRQMSLSTDARESNSSFEEQLEKNIVGVGAL